MLQFAKKVLLIEDTPDLRTSLAKALSEANHTVVAPTSYREAFEKIQEPQGAVLIDYQLPKFHDIGKYINSQFKTSRMLLNVNVTNPSLTVSISGDAYTNLSLQSQGKVGDVFNDKVAATNPRADNHAIAKEALLNLDALG